MLKRRNCISVFLLLFGFSTYSALGTCNKPANEKTFSDSLYFDHLESQNNIEVVDCPNSQDLKEKISSSMNRGFSCMRRIYELGMKSKNEQIEQRAQKIKEAYLKMMGNFTSQAVRPFRFYCSDSSVSEDSPLYLREDVNAKALTCDLQKDYLGVVMNTDTFKKRSEREIKSTIFHELFHHAGYYHERIKHDWVYSIEFCCFGYDDTSYLDLNSLGEQYSCGALLTDDHEANLPSSRAVGITLDILSGEE